MSLRREFGLWNTGETSKNYGNFLQVDYIYFELWDEYEE